MTDAIRTAAPPRYKRSRHRRRDLAYLGHAALLEESGVPGLVRGAVLACIATIAGALVWAGNAPLDEIAVTFGTILPSGSVHGVQHLEGGIVDAVMVKDGDTVAAGQVVVRMARATPVSELEQMRAREAGLVLRAARLAAFVAGTDVDLATLAPDYPELASDHAAILASSRQAVEEQARILSAAIDQEAAALDTLVAQRDSVARQLDIIREEFELRKQLYEQQLQSKVVFLETEREMHRVEASLADVDGRAAQAKTAIREARARLEELGARTKADATAELGATTDELAELRATMARMADRVERLDVVAPVAGVVKGLAITAIGQVVAPGAPILDIVPIGDVLIAEARLSTQDAGHVRVGQPAVVKVTAYDFARYGSIDGHVTDISATTFLDETTGTPFYKIKVALAADHLGDDPIAQALLTGMTVQVDVRTGDRTVLDYLLKPVDRAMEGALHEP